MIEKTGAIQRYPCSSASPLEDDVWGTNREEIVATTSRPGFTMATSVTCEKADPATTLADTQVDVRRSPNSVGFEIGRIMLALSAAAAEIGLQATLEAAIP